MGTSKIKGFGYAHGKKKVHNDEFAKHMDTNHEWIKSRTGIENRYFSEDKNTSDLACEAATKAIQKSGIDKANIDCIICATFTPDFTTPSVACLVQSKLGLNDQRVMAFDINAACSGFLYTLQVAHSLISSGEIKCALLIGAEVISKQLDFTDRNTCIIFGDGAGAMILRSEESKSVLVHYSNSCGDEDGVICSGAPQPSKCFEPKKEYTSLVHMDGSKTFRFAVKAMQESIEEVCKQANISIEDIDYFVPHQANIRIIDNVAKKLNLSKDKVFVNIQEFGNTSAASIPIALAQMDELGLLKDGTKVVCSGFGAGFTWASTYIEI